MPHSPSRRRALGSAHTGRRRAFVPLTSRISHLFQVPLRVTARCGFGLDADESFPPRPAVLASWRLVGDWLYFVLWGSEACPPRLEGLGITGHNACRRSASCEQQQSPTMTVNGSHLLKKAVGPLARSGWSRGRDAGLVHSL
ncbi:hypothetical protein BDZ89DRAFT_439198 [Hymenopellis radicata]|nr:hypothetical protein BDZ89DRAFT_439198 [Hymenopellis radicata]